MSIKKTLIKNTFFNLSGYLYLLLASFFAIPLLLHNLGRDIFGVYLFLASFVVIFSVFDLGISPAVVRKLSLPNISPEEKRLVWKTSFFFFLISAITLSLTLFLLLQYLTAVMPIFSYLDPETLQISILLLSLTVFLNQTNAHLLTLPQANQRFDIFNSKTILVGSANTILSALLSIIYPSVSALFFLQLIFHLLTSLFLVRYSRRIFTGNAFWPKPDKKTLKDLLSYGLKNFIGAIASQLEPQLSKFSLGTLASATAITAFSIPQNIVAKGAGIVSQFALSFFPLSASLLEKDRIHKLKKLILTVQLLILFGGLFAVTLTFTIGNAFLSWWLRDILIVSLAYPVLQVLSFYFVLVSLTPVPTALVQGLNKPQVSSFFAVLTVTLEISLMLILVPTLHAMGAAYAFLVSSAVSVPLFLIVSWWLLEKEVSRLNPPL